MATKTDPSPGSLTAKWKKIAEHEVLKRSSHSVAAIGEESAGDDGYKLFVFGGELVARQPKDGDVHVLNATSSSQTKPRTLNASPTSSSTSPSPTPTPRVGSTLISLQKTLYIFSGRGGPSMTALDEEGGFWTLSPSQPQPQWTFLSPSTSPSSPSPQPRSYHSTTTDSLSQIYIHAGCASSGRLRDFWSFDINSQTWQQLPDAPGRARGGTSLCFAADNVWRFGGFDGEREIGGLLDVYDVAKGEWGKSVEFEADGVKGPGARSVAGLVPVVVSGEKLYLIAIFGEADPSSLGHEGAGKMLGDVWAFDVEGEKWVRVNDTQSGSGSERPAPRGWFGAAAAGPGRLAVVGGLGEDNERLGDAWVLEF